MKSPFDRMAAEFDSFYFPKGEDDMDKEEQVNQILDIICKHVSDPSDVHNLVKDLYHNAETDLSFCDMIAEVWELIK